MRRVVLSALALALAGWAATPVPANAQGVVVTQRVSRPVVRRTVVVTRPPVRRNVVVTRTVARPGVVVGVPFVAPRVVVGGPCRTVTRQVRTAGRLVTSTSRVC